MSTIFDWVGHLSTIDLAIFILSLAFIIILVVYILQSWRQAGAVREMDARMRRDVGLPARVERPVWMQMGW